MNNPFTSNRFEQTWIKHFIGSKQPIVFEFIDGVKFYRHPVFPFYVNIGRNLTKGIHYSIGEGKTDFKGKTFLIYDVPTYFQIEELPLQQLKRRKVFQYKGYLMDLKGFQSADDYIQSRFSGKNRREFRSNIRRLESCFKMDYKFYHNQIDRNIYNALFKEFRRLLSERFEQKQTNYHHLDPKKWDFYTELVFEMINEGRASLLVISKTDTPMGITLNFHADNILFESITVFDPDYYKFSVGKTSIIKLLEWCFENGVEISDFSKGEFDYKKKWGNTVYDFNYHILYDSKSLKSRIIASLLSLFFRIKLYFRKKQVNTIYRKLQFLNSRKSLKKNDEHYLIEEVEVPENMDQYEAIDFRLPEYGFLKKFVFSFLFMHPEPEENLKVYKSSDANGYFIKGSDIGQKITFAQEVQ